MGLLHDQPRNATVTASTKLVCHKLDRMTFDQLLCPLRELIDATERRKQQNARVNSSGSPPPEGAPDAAPPATNGGRRRSIGAPGSTA
eukprot:453999-Prymnesium_polylepis.2